MLIYQRKLIVQPEITGDLLKLLFVIDGLADAAETMVIVGWERS